MIDGQVVDYLPATPSSLDSSLCVSEELVVDEEIPLISPRGNILSSSYLLA